MFTLKHLTGLLGFLFSLSILYYNYSYQFNWEYGYHTASHFAQIPNFAAYKSLATRKQAFEHYISQYAVKDNQFMQQMQYSLRYVYQQFLQKHKLSYTQLFWLSLLYGNANTFDPYQKSTWQDLLNHTDIAPANVLLKYSNHNSNNPYIFRQTLNDDFCSWRRSIFSKQPSWLRQPRCFSTSQLLTTMQLLSPSIIYKKFYDLTDAYAYSIFTANVSPAFHEFRRLRQQWRARHPLATSWQMVNNTQTLNPERLYNKRYYMNQQ